MIVACPNCGTKFNLPDDKIQPGAQLRCSVCKHLFGIPDASGHMPGQLEDKAPPVQQAAAKAPPPSAAASHSEADDSAEDDSPYEDEELDLNVDFGSSSRKQKKVKSSFRKGPVVFLLLLLLGGGAGGVWYFMGDKLLEMIPFVNRGAAVSQQDMVSKITLRGVRQYSIANEKLGTLSVIEGKAVNGFAESRELIKVEATLYDKDGQVLATKQQMAGTSVSLFQLQVLGEKELEQALGNRIEILTNNTNVPREGEVPFMVVFYKSPENATEFGVKVIEARLPPK